MRAVVVGGGVAGLTAAWRLVNARHEVTLIEATERLGGLIHSGMVGGTTMDLGAEAFAVARPETIRLIEEIGLAHLVEEPANSAARILLNGRLIKIPHGVLGVPSNLDSAEVLEAIGPGAVAEAKRLDAMPWTTKADGTLADLVRDRLGESVLSTLVAPVVAGVHASDPSLLEADAVAPGLYARAAQLGSLSAAAAAMRATAARPGAAVATLNGGMTQLIGGLERAATQAGVTLRLSTPAIKVSRTQDGYQITLADSSELEAEILVVATPPSTSAELLTEMPELAHPLSQISAVDVTVVGIKAKNAHIGRAPLGSGVLVAPGSAAVVAKASTHTSAKWNSVQDRAGKDQHLIRLSYGRDGNAPAASNSLEATARQDAVRLFGLNESDISSVVMQEWPSSLIQARSGHGQLVKTLTESLQMHPRLGIVGAGLGGNGITGIIAKVNQEIQRISRHEGE